MDLNTIGGVLLTVATIGMLIFVYLKSDRPANRSRPGRRR